MVNMVTTKEQERKALAKIREIVESLGEYSYVGTAFKGCFEIAEENIKYDFCDSMEARLALATRETEIAIQERKSLTSENEELKSKVVHLEEQLEREQEWEAYEEKENVSRTGYENLAMQDDTHQLSEEEAKQMIHRLFGFETGKIEIVTSVPVYEINRHRQLRVAGHEERRPLYNATDWNYIRFDCCGMSYEFYNDNLRFFIQ